MRKFEFNNKGFSLVELVIVIAVLSILSAVAIPAFLGVILNARQAAAVAYIDATLKSGLTFNSFQGRWPTSWEEFAQNSNVIDASVSESCARFNAQCEGNQRPIVNGNYLIEFYTRGNELRVSAWRFSNVGPTKDNRSAWGCLNLARGGEIYAWKDPHFYNGPAWKGENDPIRDDNNEILSMCGQNP